MKLQLELNLCFSGYLLIAQGSSITNKQDLTLASSSAGISPCSLPSRRLFFTSRDAAAVSPSFLLLLASLTAVCPVGGALIFFFF